jgi:hypothetical protein
MKTIIAALAALLMAVAAASAPIDVEADGESLMRYIEDTQDYREWRLWPGTERMYEGTSPHGAYLTTFVNLVAYDAIRHQTAPLPPGSIIVKENYGKDRKLKSVTVMQKILNYDQEHGDWFYLKFKPQEAVIQAEGKVESCMSCHAKAKDNDWLFTSDVTGE